MDCLKQKVKQGKRVADDELKDEAKMEEVAVEVEPKTGISFHLKLDDGKQLGCVGLRTKHALGMNLKIYAYGMYADSEKLKDLLKSKIGEAPATPTEEMYQLVIDSDVCLVIRWVIVFPGLSTSMFKKNRDDRLVESIKKLSGDKKNAELADTIMAQAPDSIKVPPGSVMEIHRIPGYILQIKVAGEVVSKVEGELLSRAYIHMYLGDDALDKDAREKFGTYLLSLF
ncbi:chalcone isomerase-like protein 1 [Corylus avellana]|uniref:chalcone isomerase-like protein 1 n=1 Tax=Corylus avellana TaxID=13451 RepID=UPI001E21B3BF|nr:chalcone isomerase-like protein 1 [Corylus avellana]